MKTLTEDQRLEIDQTGELRLIDPRTQQQYVAVKAEVYERLKDTLDHSSWTPEEMDMLSEEAGRMLDNFGKAE